MPKRGTVLAPPGPSERLAAPAGADTPEAAPEAPPSQLKPQTNIVAIDPGDEHCGLAVVRVHSTGLVQPIRAEEKMPNDCADHVAAWLLEGWVDAVVVERFSLYGDRAQAQVGSQMETAQLIGVLRYIVRLANRGRRDEGLPTVPFVLQGADIKKGIRAQAKARGIELLPASADHPRDAQLHGIYYAGRELLRWGA